jgi:hypothetical protein
MAPFLSALLDPVRRAAAVPGLRRLVVVWAVQERAHLGWFAVSWPGGWGSRLGEGTVTTVISRAIEGVGARWQR